jgi:hypothetical protein
MDGKTKINEDGKRPFLTDNNSILYIDEMIATDLLSVRHDSPLERR